MRAALSHEFKSIIPTYDERPRTKWIFENSVQNTVVVSRLFFTQEVRLAFWLLSNCRCLHWRWQPQADGVRMSQRDDFSCHGAHPPPFPVQVNEAFEELEDGNEDALKEVLERQKSQLRWGVAGEGSSVPASGKPCLRACSWASVRTVHTTLCISPPLPLHLLLASCLFPRPILPLPLQRPDRADQWALEQERPEEAHHALHCGCARARRGAAHD